MFMARSSVLAFLAAASTVLVSSCGGGADDAPAVQPGLLGAATFDAQTMPSAQVFSAWTGAIACNIPYPGETARMAKLATVLNAGVNIKSTSCSISRQVVLMVCMGQAVNHSWLVEAPDASLEQMQALGFHKAQGPNTDFVIGPCK